MRKPILALAAVIATTSLAACGGVDKNAYVEQVTNVQQATQKEAQELSSKMSSAKTPKQVAANLDALGEAVEANAKKLDAIEAPEDVAKQHQAYVDLMTKFGTDLEALAAKVEKATPTTVPGILSQASTLTTNLSTGETKIVNEINSALKG